MGINRSIASSACKIFSFSIRNVLAITLNVALSQSKIENKYLVGSLIKSNAEVIGLNISMDEMSVVDVFDARNHLIDQHQH